MAGSLSSSLVPPGKTTRSAGASWGPEKGDRQEGEGGYRFPS